MADLRPVYVAGDGDVKGPASSSNNELPLLNGSTGKLIKGSGTVVTAQGLALLDDNTPAEQRTTLQLGSAALQNSTAAGNAVLTAADLASQQYLLGQGSLRGIAPYTVSAQILSSDVGKLIAIASGSSIAITLPNIADIPVGATLTILNTGAGVAGIYPYGSDILNSGSGSLAAIFASSGDNLYLVRGGSGWTAYGGSAQARYSDAFATSYTATGIKRIAGLLVQWGAGTSSPTIGASTTITLPTGFTGGHLCTLVTRTGGTIGTDFNTFSTDNTGLFSFTVKCQIASATFRWLALGF